MYVSISITFTKCFVVVVSLVYFIAGRPGKKTESGNSWNIKQMSMQGRIQNAVRVAGRWCLMYPCEFYLLFM